MPKPPPFTPPQITITAEVQTWYDHDRPYHWATRTITVPSWCSGDPAMAMALYLFGHRDSAPGIRNARVL